MDPWGSRWLLGVPVVPVAPHSLYRSPGIATIPAAPAGPRGSLRPLPGRHPRPPRAPEPLRPPGPPPSRPVPAPLRPVPSPGAPRAPSRPRLVPPELPAVRAGGGEGSGVRRRPPGGGRGVGRGRPGRSGLPGVRRFPGAVAEAAPGRRSRDIVTGTKEKEPAPDGAGRGHRTPWVLRQGVWASLTGGCFLDPQLGAFANCVRLYVWLFLLGLPLGLYSALPPGRAVAAVYCALVAAFFGAVKAVTFRLHARLDRRDPRGDPEGGAAALLPPRSPEGRRGTPAPPGGDLELSVLRWPSATPPQLCGFNQLSELLPHLDTASGAGELPGILTAADRDRLRSVGGGGPGGGTTPDGAGGDSRTPLTLLHPPPAELGVPPGSPPPSPPQGGGSRQRHPPGTPPLTEGWGGFEGETPGGREWGGG
ncbi:pecanex-like protein 3 isoform X2 [Chamaea fasciata]|uniref:pecanex-like protein 3 isoform X2 n=1 Tax=Chamaea fasciata TaxID=190680 RepID=UPI00336A6D60